VPRFPGYFHDRVRDADNDASGLAVARNAVIGTLS